MRGGAFLKGKEGRVGFRNSLLFERTRLMIHIIIMAGGVGSRFWPMSTPDYPKQFIDVMGVGLSLIQLTVDRLKPICPVENMWVVTNEKYISIVKEQIPDMPVDNILAEPELHASHTLAGRYRSSIQRRISWLHHPMP